MSEKSLGQSLYQFTKIFEFLEIQAKDRGDEDFLKICEAIRNKDIKSTDLVRVKAKPKRVVKKRED